MHGSAASKIKALDRTAQPCHTPSAPSEEKMEDNRDEQAPPGPERQAVSPGGGRAYPGGDRRKFIRALGAPGAAAAAAPFLDSKGLEGSPKRSNHPPVLYQDSFENIGPADPTALAAGI